MTSLVPGNLWSGWDFRSPQATTHVSTHREWSKVRWPSRLVMECSTMRYKAAGIFSKRLLLTAVRGSMEREKGRGERGATACGWHGVLCPPDSILAESSDSQRARTPRNCGEAAADSGLVTRSQSRDGRGLKPRQAAPSRPASAVCRIWRAVSAEPAANGPMEDDH